MAIAATTTSQLLADLLDPEGTAAEEAWELAKTKRLGLESFFWLWFVGVAALSIWHGVGWGLSRRMRVHGRRPSEAVVAMVGWTVISRASSLAMTRSPSSWRTSARCTHPTLRAA